MVAGFFLWNWSPSWLDPGVNRLLMFLDPGGFRWLNETYLKVDRGVDFYNQSPMGFDGLFIANRLVLLAIGLGAVGLAQWKFARDLRGVRHGKATAAAAGDVDDEAGVVMAAVNVGSILSSGAHRKAHERSASCPAAGATARSTPASAARPSRTILVMGPPATATHPRKWHHSSQRASSSRRSRRLFCCGPVRMASPKTLKKWNESLRRKQSPASSPFSCARKSD